MKNKLFLLAAVIALFAASFFSSKAFADLSVTDLNELNNATPGLSRINSNTGANSGTGLGNFLKGRAINGCYGCVAGEQGNGNINSNSPSTTAAGYSLIKWQVPTSSNWSIPLGDGTPGQMLTIVKANTGTIAGKVSPTTKSGFTDATLTNQGDGVTFQYKDDTSGWTPIGAFGGSSTVGKVNP